VSARTERWLARADRLEDYWRDFAFLGLTEELNIGGHKIEVQLLTLRMFIQLEAVRSPFLVGGKGIGPEDIAILLWRLSPIYETRKQNKNARKKFMRSIAKLPFQLALRACDRYLDRMLIDHPPAMGKKTGRKIDTSFAATVIHQIASAYGWSDELILDLPIPRIFQYMRKIHRANNDELAYFNPIRDKMKKRIMSKILETRKAQRESFNGNPINGRY
jgi:hypothetical protein